MFQESLISLNCEVSIMAQIDSCMLASWPSGNYISWVNEVKWRSRPLQICCQFCIHNFQSAFLAHLCKLYGGLIFITVRMSVWTWPKIGDKTWTVHVSDYILRKIHFNNWVSCYYWTRIEGHNVFGSICPSVCLSASQSVLSQLNRVQQRASRVITSLRCLSVCL